MKKRLLMHCRKKIRLHVSVRCRSFVLSHGCDRLFCDLKKHRQSFLVIALKQIMILRHLLLDRSLPADERILDDVEERRVRWKKVRLDVCRQLELVDLSVNAGVVHEKNV